MKSLKNFILENKRDIHNIIGLSNTTTEDIINFISPFIDEIIEDCELDIEVIDYYVHGSRVFGKPKKDSDIDVVLYYKGNMREDALFDVFHDEDYKDEFMYDGYEIDINPIRDQETGSLDRYIEKDKNYYKN